MCRIWSYVVYIRTHSKDLRNHTEELIAQFQKQYTDGAAAIEGMIPTNTQSSVCVVLKCIAGPHIGQRFRLEATDVSFFKFTSTRILDRSFNITLLVNRRTLRRFSKWDALPANNSRRRVFLCTRTRKSPLHMLRWESLLLWLLMLSITDWFCYVSRSNFVTERHFSSMRNLRTAVCSMGKMRSLPVLIVWRRVMWSVWVRQSLLCTCQLSTRNLLNKKSRFKIECHFKMVWYWICNVEAWAKYIQE